MCDAFENSYRALYYSFYKKTPPHSDRSREQTNTFLVESLATDLARVWFVSAVNSHVSVESAASVEGFVAYCTSVGLLIRVNYFVSA